MAFEKVTAKFDGRYYEKQLSDLELSNLDDPSDSNVIQAMALAIGQETGTTPNLSGFVVDRFESVLNVRPSAVYG